MKYLYEAVFLQPLLNILVFFYQTIAFGDLGLAIVFLTLLIRLILFPVFHRSARYQIIMQKIQPDIKRIREAHPRDLERQSRELMALYREHRINPFSGFLFILIQIPILIALYHIFLQSLTPGALDGLYAFVSAPARLETTFLGLINLEKASIIVAGFAAAAQYIQGWIGLAALPQNPNPTAGERISRQMVYFGPFITLLIFANLPAAVSLYWATTSIFSVLQQYIINRKLHHGTLGHLHQKTR